MKRARILAFGLLVAIGSVVALEAAGQGNPFVTRKDRGGGAEWESPSRPPGAGLSTSGRIARAQGELTARWTRLCRDFQEDRSGRAIAIILLVSFAYGVVHGLGPGHGKAIVFSYLLARRVSLLRAILMGSLIMFVHVGSAMTVVLVIWLVTRLPRLSSFESASRTIRIVSYSLVTAIGGLLLAGTVRRSCRREEEETRAAAGGEEGSTGGMVAVSLASGIVPCPGATMILLFAVSKDVLGIGIASAVAMALGLAVTVSGTAIVTVLAKGATLKLASRKRRWTRVLGTSVELSGAALMLLVGAFLLVWSVRGA